MEQQRTFWVLGGDKRQLALARLLAEEGCRVFTLALGNGSSTDGPIPVDEFCPRSMEEAVVLPLPVVSAPGILNAPLASQPIHLSSILEAAQSGQPLFGGKVDRDTQTLAQAKGLTIRDYLDREELAVSNAVPTAEGAVQLAMEKLPITIHGARVLLLGFGRVGQATAQRFAALGAKVTVAARRYEALARAESMGLNAAHLGQFSLLPVFDLVVNTIPAPVLDRAALKHLRPDCLILDLASKPGGVDFDAARDLGLETVHALALPGKVAPVTAGKAIKEAICNMLAELEREVSIGK